MIFRVHPISRPHHRRGFTLVEVIIASVIAVFVLSSVTISLSQLNRARETSQLRLNAHVRADMAMTLLRRDIASIIRHEDLFWTRLLIQSSMLRTPLGEADRDSILVFSTHLRSVNNLDFSGEGMQHEMQYRIEEDADGAMLWQRRDPVPDEHPLGGGIASPVVEGVISLRFEAYDGYEWWENWDSDEHGLPHAVRITVAASGARNGEELYEAPHVVLRTVVAIDRVMPPIDLFDEEEEIDEDELEDVSDPTVREAEAERRRGRGQPDARSPGTRPDARPRPDGRRDGQGRGGRDRGGRERGGRDRDGGRDGGRGPAQLRPSRGGGSS